MGWRWGGGGGGDALRLITTSTQPASSAFILPIRLPVCQFLISSERIVFFTFATLSDIGASSKFWFIEMALCEVPQYAVSR